MSFILEFLKGSFISLLGLAILASGIAIAYTTHQARHLQNDLQLLLKQKDALRNEWTQLLLEQSVWATDVRVDSVARNDLGMLAPANSNIMVIEP